MDAALEASTMRKVYLRLLPFAVLSYILAYLDRINVSFAALTMRDDLHIGAGDFGFAVGTFYWGYFLFEVPSNIILEKVGARIWIARIMITWGIFATATAFVTGTTTFGIVRFLVGLPIAVAFGAPISTGLMSLHGLFGLKGWQVMYLAEGVPTILIGIATYFVMTNKPEQAKFLTAEERNWLVAKLAGERKAK